MMNIKNDRGMITVNNEVFSRLAGDAATSCFGVKGMVSISSDGSRHQLLKRDSMSKGVYVRYYEDESVSLDMHIGVDYGVNISAVCHQIINEVKYKLEKSTGISVKSVDVFIDNIIA